MPKIRAIVALALAFAIAACSYNPPPPNAGLRSGKGHGGPTHPTKIGR